MVHHRPKNVIGSQIRKTRYQQGWSQSDLATRLQLVGLDIRRSGVAKIESQIRHVSDDELIAILHVLRVHFEDLLPSRPINDTRFRDYYRRIIDS